VQRKINAKLILASKNAHTGVILYTWVLTYPRTILAEFNTHRMMSRNTASSRAVPSKKMRKSIMDVPFVPYVWGSAQKGMQGGAEIYGWRRALGKAIWRGARYPAVAANWALEKLGFHKQIGNRLIEPWQWTEQVVTATDVNNILLLRDHKDAEPHFQILARQMRYQVERTQQTFAAFALWNSGVFFTPNGGPTLQILNKGEWHLPFIDLSDWDEAELATFHWKDMPDEQMNLIIGRLLKISAARCARVSYYLPENGKTSTYDRDRELHDRLVEAKPRHMSPVEHQATPTREDVYLGNFRSWKQYRKLFDDEHGGDRAGIVENVEM
jgi:hypothetical protein